MSFRKKQRGGCKFAESKLRMPDGNWKDTVELLLWSCGYSTHGVRSQVSGISLLPLWKTPFYVYNVGKGGWGRALYIHSRVQLQSCLKFCHILMIIVNPGIRTVLLFLKCNQSIILIHCALSAKHLRKWCVQQ